MAYFGGGVKGAASGAGIGFALGGPLGAGIGALGGFVSGLFDESPEEAAQRRLNEVLASIRERKVKALKTGTSELNTMVASQAAGARQGAAQRALALGKAGDAEAFVNPAEGQVRAAGSQAYTRMRNDIDRQYSQAEAAAELGYANTPSSPGFTDYLLPVGEAAFTYGMNKEFQTPDSVKPWQPPTLGEVKMPDIKLGLSGVTYNPYSR